MRTDSRSFPSAAMSLFGSPFHDPSDMFMSSCMRQMRHMNNMMNSMFSDSMFGMMGDMRMPLPIMGPMHGNALMPYMGDMNINRVLNNDMMNAHCNSFSSSTVVMSSGPDGKQQVYSSTNSTKVGPNGVKETRQTVQDSRTGTKKISIGHHINERAHLIEREQNVRSGDLEERQEFINIDEDDADDFNREFEERARVPRSRRRASPMRALPAPPPRHSPMRALPAPPTSSRKSGSNSASARRPVRQTTHNPNLSSSSSGSGVRHTYGSAQPQRFKQRPSKSHHNYTDY